MVNVVKPAKVITTTKDGQCEISISIELNINLNNNTQQPSVTETSVVAQTVKEKVKEEKKEETFYAIPDFTNLKKVQFGKEIQ